ncbi:MAG TPA: PQQ-dependent sugar dehydrogenase [Mycobacteriales bacterium]|nr:PQQ-dependent sugar dehydrogenase [Mycobacteriales bacterium]
MARPRWIATILMLGALAATACSNDQAGDEPHPDDPIGTPRVIAEHLHVPWGVVFLPGGDAVVGERTTGMLLRIGAGGRIHRIGKVPGAIDRGEGGLLGLALSPSYRDDRLLYAYFTSGTDNRVVRFTLRGDTIGPEQPVFTGIEAAPIHDGGRIAFGPDGLLYVAVGDASDGDVAQNPNAPNGKILRLTPDGKPAPGNPRPGSPVYTLGHRNPQGLAWGPKNRLYQVEFGQDKFDEINLLHPGGNYGWPIVEGDVKDDRFTRPLVTWPTSEASPSGVAYANGALWVGALRGERLYRVPVHDDGTLGRPESLLTGRYGRIRTVVVAPDHSLWLTTSNRDGRGSPAAADDRIIRVPMH